ncbi:Putative pyridoxal-phosphate dependent enzyme, peptidase M20, peptidase M20, dimerization [Septoria linicola]|uniref:Pyridoxal-phosphate dependent enzyme, peptidase M20, peptidase M20, dimerization n=1 Tax=Septoria linicola TaxID=215465 RepID=A0A9Q9EJJ8_9PEZI|nr:putative pyridoxal-phosphate dependent enzyme, peptidase M20, peptidase M20, dimerization [Septoria linicola]USW52262.1 Putative pyridoxal-phosphate dependent enzyme, peptidase M20, peptidase M20, dimerization [Septoria linicola]
MSRFARQPFFQHEAQSWHSTPSDTTEQAFRFHKTLPGYETTPLTSLDDLTKEVGVKAVYVKDESRRLGLPSFKILGASWGTFRAVVSRLHLPLETSLDTLRLAAEKSSITLHAATDGNHGRAVAWIGQQIGLPAEIRVPSSMHPETIKLIRSEGAHVIISEGGYDQAVQEAWKAANVHDDILIQDFALGDYQDVPQWIVEGYQTMMHEIEDQLHGQKIDLIFAPVGVGSFAHAVTSHFRRPGSDTSIVAVEPDTAASLRKSLENGEPTSINTTHTIMAGLDCGTPSSSAWPVLKAGVRASMTISYHEAHIASRILQTDGVSAGPCGGSPLAALRRLSPSDKAALGLDQESVVVLPCTEGVREYDPPHDVTIDDPVELTQQLVQINSASPTMGTTPGPGETEIARYVAAWLQHRGLECHWIESKAGRPSVVGVAGGTGGDKSLMFNGHIDTVTLVGYDADPLSGIIADGKLYGHGAADMKCGVAAAMVALANAKQLKLRGDVVFAGVADEEDLSIGTEDVLRAGWRADAALVNGPTNLHIIHAHKGFVWLEIDIYGLAAHGSRADLGIDAIVKAGQFVAALDDHAAELQKSHPDSLVGPPTIHASMIKGGEEASSYPARCKITIERRTIAGENAVSVEAELRKILEGLQSRVKDFKYDVRATFERPPFELPRDSAFCQLVSETIVSVLGKEPRLTAEPYWTDCALLAEKGIELLWGPIGDGLHAKEK